MRQKVKLRLVQLRVRPGGRAGPQGHIARGRHNSHRIVVALQHPGPLRLQGHDLVQHPHRVGTIAHQIAQKSKVVRAFRSGMGQTGIQRLTVGVQI